MKTLARILACVATLLTPAYAQKQLAGSYTANGLAGAGFINIANQSVAPTTPVASGLLYFDSGNDLAWKEAGGFIGKIDLGAASRTVTLSGSPTLGDWFDQSVKTGASPTFVNVTGNLTGNITGSAPAGLLSGTTLASNVVFRYEVATIAALKAISVSGLATGAGANVIGFYAVADGGSGLFAYDSASSATEVSGMIVAPNSGGGRWNRIYDGPIDVRWLGAKAGVVSTGYFENSTSGSFMPGSSDFSIYLRFKVPTYGTAYQGVAKLAPTGSSNRDVEIYGSGADFSLLVRSTSGGSGAGAGKLFAIPNPLTPGATQRVVFVRSSGVFAVYLDGVDVTSSFAITNASDLAGVIGNGATDGAWSVGRTSSFQVSSEPIVVAHLFARALTPTQAANPDSQLDFVAATESLNEDFDSQPAIQAALDYAHATNNPVLYVPGGNYMCRTGLLPWYGTTIRGDRSTIYSNAEPASMISYVAPDASDSLLTLDQSRANQNDPMLSQRLTADGSYLYNYSFNGGVERLTLNAVGATYASALSLYHVANSQIEDVNLTSAAANLMLVNSANVCYFRNVKQTALGSPRGVLVWGTADCSFSGFDMGGAAGPNLYFLTSNKNLLSESFIYNSVSPRSFTPSAVNTGTGEITSVGNVLARGTPIRFVANGGTLPSPLVENVTYYAIPTDAVAGKFKLNSQYDQGVAPGALQGTAMAITTTGSGSFLCYEVSPYSTNIQMTDTSGNSVTGVRADQSFGQAMVIEGGFGTTVTSSSLSESGQNGSSGMANVLLRGTTDATFTGNVLGKLRPESAATIGFRLEDYGATHCARVALGSNAFYSLTTNISLADANQLLAGVVAPYFEGLNQSAAPSTPTGSGRAYFDASNRLAWIDASARVTSLAVSANTAVTLPTTGTLATLAGTEALTNKTYNGNTITAGTGTLTMSAGKTLTLTNSATVNQSVDTAASVTFQQVLTAGGSVNFAAGTTEYNQLVAYGVADSGGTTSIRGVRINTEGTGANNYTLVNGARINASSAASGTVGMLSGLLVSANIFGTGTVSNFRLLDLQPQMTGASNANVSGGLAYIVPVAISPTSGDITGTIEVMNVPNVGRAAATTTTVFGVADQTKGSGNAYAYRGQMTSGTGKYNLYMSGTAANLLTGDLQLAKTVTAAGTTGAQTIDKTSGTVNLAASATSLVVTNSLVTANSIINCTVAANDTTCKSVVVVAASGSFTIYPNVAPTAETRVNFVVTN